MSSITGSCCESPSKILFEKGLEQRAEKLSIEKQNEMENKKLAESTISAETNTDPNSSQQNNHQSKEGFKGLNIDYFA